MNFPKVSVNFSSKNSQNLNIAGVVNLASKYDYSIIFTLRDLTFSR